MILSLCFSSVDVVRMCVGVFFPLHFCMCVRVVHICEDWRMQGNSILNPRHSVFSPTTEVLHIFFSFFAGSKSFGHNIKGQSNLLNVLFMIIFLGSEGTNKQFFQLDEDMLRMVLVSSRILQLDFGDSGLAFKSLHLNHSPLI